MVHMEGGLCVMADQQLSEDYDHPDNIGASFQLSRSCSPCKNCGFFESAPNIPTPQQHLSPAQAATEASQLLETAYLNLQQSWADQKEQLAALISEQHASSSALLTSARDTVAAARSRLEAAREASGSCQEAVSRLMSQQNSALTQMEEAYAQRMGQEKV